MTVSLVILGILAGITAAVMIEGGGAFARASSQADNVESARVGMQRLVRDLSHINTNNAASIPSFTASSIRFITYDGEDLTYSVPGGTETLTRNRLGGPVPVPVLADFVTAFALRYFSNNETVLVPGVDPATSIWVIEVTLTVLRSGQTVTLRTRVHPRRFSDATWRED